MVAHMKEPIKGSKRDKSMLRRTAKSAKKAMTKIFCRLRLNSVFIFSPGTMTGILQEGGVWWAKMPLSDLRPFNRTVYSHNYRSSTPRGLSWIQKGPLVRLLPFRGKNLFWKPGIYLFLPLFSRCFSTPFTLMEFPWKWNKLKVTTFKTCWRKTKPLRVTPDGKQFLPNPPRFPRHQPTWRSIKCLVWVC